MKRYVGCWPRWLTTMASCQIGHRVQFERLGYRPLGRLLTGAGGRARSGPFSPRRRSGAGARGAADGFSRPLPRINPPPGVDWQSPGVRTGSLPDGPNRAGEGRLSYLRRPPSAGPGRKVGSHMAIQWFYQRGGRPSGPVDSRELRRLAEAGNVTPNTRWYVRALVAAGYAPRTSGVYCSHPRPRLHLHLRLCRCLRRNRSPAR